MESWNPYHDTELYFDAPSPLCQSQILDAREMLGSATGHYQARTVRPSMQYFDCDLSFTEPLRTHKVLPEGLCIVQMFDGQWRHSVDGGEPYLYNLGGPSVLGTGEPMEAFDILPAGSRVRLGGLRIAASYLEEELETGDGALRPLARLKGDGASFTQLSRCGAITALFERLYQNPYRGALGRLHEESLTLGLLVELAAYLGGADLRRARTPRAQRDLAHEARRLLEANLGEPPASLELARQLGVGETTLRRIFRNEFGRSMLQYVRDRRLEIGRQMVREGRWQIAQIAYRLGYSSPENFTHAYRARFGHPPGRE
ncbi:AraC family transcriptional regulator [Pseudomonas aeruginosa BL15]|nr:AraC family transcriptional regulator [Pseudomonas aeruginosa]EOT16679.1 AraC family transcriptional regulator [Pseudomonas aeruginosa PA14]ERV31379.1 AraC family transcriptional regulator [Pseudomonas aeruginosa BL16]ERV32909.1 AraC family transcriptional regulator [Pseudomonas aeruginosa BL15]ERV89504.1 AraC family transcriptional regulator [Pseudomonas aeruginosa BWHPSA027]ERX97151.1 AraC family transcriptional regulator [Pseudomonas aeruginosa BL25]ETD45044.1 AraC family transcriptiona